MTPEEVRAKRQWGTNACQAPGCTAGSAYLVLEVGTEEPHAAEWWQYCCRKHARQFAMQHGLEMPGYSAAPLVDARAS